MLSVESVRCYARDPSPSERHQRRRSIKQFFVRYAGRHAARPPDSGPRRSSGFPTLLIFSAAAAAHGGNQGHDGEPFRVRRAGHPPDGRPRQGRRLADGDARRRRRRRRTSRTISPTWPIRRPTSRSRWRPTRPRSSSSRFGTQGDADRRCTIFISLTPQVPEMKAWYVDVFGARPGKRGQVRSGRYAGRQPHLFPIRRSPWSAPAGASLDHIGFEIKGLEAFCRKLEDDGDRARRTVRRRTTGLNVGRGVHHRSVGNVHRADGRVGLESRPIRFRYACATGLRRRRARGRSPTGAHHDHRAGVPAGGGGSAGRARGRDPVAAGPAAAARDRPARSDAWRFRSATSPARSRGRRCSPRCSPRCRTSPPKTSPS